MRLIDADAFDKFLEEAETVATRRKKYVFASVLNVIRGNLKAFPTIEERKPGQWIDGQCSICGCDIPAYIIDWRWQKDMDAKFCPNCGAHMEGLKDEVD